MPHVGNQPLHSDPASVKQPNARQVSQSEYLDASSETLPEPVAGLEQEADGAV